MNSNNERGLYTEASIPHKPKMDIAYSHISSKFINSPYIRKILKFHTIFFNLDYVFWFDLLFAFPYFDHDALSCFTGR